MFSSAICAESMDLHRPHDQAGSVLGIDVASPMPPNRIFADAEFTPYGLLPGAAGKQ